MTTNEARNLVIQAINQDNFYYSHVLPPVYTDWIDGLAWGSLARGAALLKEDFELASLFYEYTQRIMTVGENARNYAPFPVKEDWIASTIMPGFWYKKKPQSFAGPAALKWSNKCAKMKNKPLVENPFNIDRKAQLMTSTGWLFGNLCRWFKYPRQHINSYWLAYLCLNKKPPKAMLWMAEENPFFSFIAGIKCVVSYPELYRTSEGYEIMRKVVMPLCLCEPSAWIFRRDPFVEYVRKGMPTKQYTPIWKVVGDYLQGLL